MTMTSAQIYAEYEADFYRHYQQHCAEHGSWHGQYRPAYRYGYELGVHQRYGAAPWEQIEPEVRLIWEQRNPGTWEQFKGSIYHAWATAHQT